MINESRLMTRTEYEERYLGRPPRGGLALGGVRGRDAATTWSRLASGLRGMMMTLGLM